MTEKVKRSHRGYQRLGIYVNSYSASARADFGSASDVNDGENSR
jgi:hypothetical protein